MPNDFEELGLSVVQFPAVSKGTPLSSGHSSHETVFHNCTVTSSSFLPPMPIMAMQIWILWRNDNNVLEGQRPRKKPISVQGGTATSVDRLQADTYAEAYPHMLAMGANGIGCVLGPLPDGRVLIGIDLDTCRDAKTGVIEPWAQHIVAKTGIYFETSPSLTGVKGFATIAAADIPAIEAAILRSKNGRGSKHSRKWAWRGREHPPAIELYTAGKWFAFTGQHLIGTPREW